jgi:hypothetical protein
MLDDDALASDVGPHFGNVTVGLGKVTANHRIESWLLALSKDRELRSQWQRAAELLLARTCANTVGRGVLHGPAIILSHSRSSLG